MASLVELLNDAFVDAKARDGRRVSFTLYELEGARVSATASLFDVNDTIVDMRTWETELPVADAARMEAFAKALRALPLDWEEMYPEEFPPWKLLDVATLVSADDFARVMSSRELLRTTLAHTFAASLSPGTSPGAAIVVGDDDAIRLYELELCTFPQATLEAHIDALTRAAAPLLLALLERWQGRGDDGFVTHSGGSMRDHLAQRAVAKLAELARLMPDVVDVQRLARLGIALPPDVDAVFRNAGEIVEVGTIELDSTGRVIAADPYFADVSAIATGAQREDARCPVCLALVTLPDWGMRVSFARLDLRAARATTWRSTGHRFFVDAGLACFMTEAARDALRRELDACHASGRNHYEAILADVLKAGRDKWGVHVVEGHRIAVFASGIGDGSYEVLEGVDADGRVVSLAIDFAILEDASTDAQPTEVHLEKTRFAALPTFTDEGAAGGTAAIDERFQRIRLIGTGGVGEVFLARDRVLDREVALKVMKRVPHGAVPTLLDEARAMSLVRHPNVVALLDAGAHKGDVFIALEYVAGTNLRQQMKRGAPMPRARALAVLRDVARGLAAAHAVDVLHLDVKPENVLVGVDDVARVVDFGLARVRSGNACIDLGAGPPSGTPAYMAPELWAGEGVCDGTDVWSYAILAHELLTGTRPFEASSSAEMMALVLAGLDEQKRARLDFGGDADAEVTAPLVELLRNGLLRNRHARPTMREIEAALDVLSTERHERQG